MSRVQMLTDTLADKRAWRASTIDYTRSWYYSLSEGCLSAFDTFIQDLRHRPRPTTEILLREPFLDGCGACLQPVLTDLNSGRGFAIVERVPVERYTDEETQAIYWRIGQFLGVPFTQNIKGTLLYDVRDTGQKVTNGVRFSVTNAESSFHIDNSFGKRIPDFVGLLCLHTAKLGGQNQLISACALHNELLDSHPDVLHTFYHQPFYFDRRGQFKQGESPTCHAPIFHWDGQELTTRYLHYYIQVGHQQAGQPLTPDQEKALEVIEALLRQPNFRVEFSLKPGQMLFTNNRWILHNRTEFEDYPDPAHRRHYVRLWLSRSGAER